LFDGRKIHTFSVQIAHVDGISPQLNAKFNVVALEEQFLVVFLEYNGLFHETDRRIEAVVVGRVRHLSVLGVYMQLFYKLWINESDLQRVEVCGRIWDTYTVHHPPYMHSELWMAVS
jgi:hypothetical protein